MDMMFYAIVRVRARWRINSLPLQHRLCLKIRFYQHLCRLGLVESQSSDPVALTRLRRRGHYERSLWVRRWIMRGFPLPPPKSHRKRLPLLRLPLPPKHDGYRSTYCRRICLVVIMEVRLTSATHLLAQLRRHDFGLAAYFHSHLYSVRNAIISLVLTVLLVAL